MQTERNVILVRVDVGMSQTDMGQGLVVWQFPAAPTLASLAGLADALLSAEEPVQMLPGRVRRHCRLVRDAYRRRCRADIRARVVGARALVVFVVDVIDVVGRAIGDVEAGWNRPIDGVWGNNVSERERVVRHSDEEETTRRNGDEKSDLNPSHTVAQAGTRLVLMRALPYEDWHRRITMW